MEPGSGAGGIEPLHAAGKKGCDNPCERVARAGGCKPRRRIVIDGRPPVGVGDDRLRSLQKHGCAALRGGSHRPLGPVQFAVVQIGKKAAEFAFMRCQHHRCFTPVDRGKRRLTLGSGPRQRIGIEDDRLP